MKRETLKANVDSITLFRFQTFPELAVERIAA